MTTRRLLGFIMGAGVGAVVLFNGRGVRRGLAKAYVKSEKAAIEASQRFMKASSEMVEDFQDAIAEARLEEAQKPIDPAAILSELRDLRHEMASVAPATNPTVQ